MCFKDLFVRKPVEVVVVPPPAPDPDPTESVESKLTKILKKPTVDIQNLLPETKLVLLDLSELILKETGKVAVITNAKRSVETQKAEMERLKKEFGQAYYDKVYGRFERSGAKIEDLPHVQGRAGDFRYSGYEKMIAVFQHFNDIYLSHVREVIGYVPSMLIVIETHNCFHVQTARGITDQNRALYIDFIREIIKKVQG